MAKTILLSQYPLPYHKIGSWTSLYLNYLKSDQHLIDYIICPPIVSPPFDNIKYFYLEENLVSKVKQKIFKNNKLPYFEQLKKILSQEPNEKFVIQIVDNLGLLREIHEFLEQNSSRARCYIQFFFHGFEPVYTKDSGDTFFKQMDELILLTNDSYTKFKEFYVSMPVKCSILYNGVETSLFKKLSLEEKKNQREEMGVLDKKVFVWCSQDRPKKGLFLLLKIWPKLKEKYPNIELWAIGCEPKKEIQGVKYWGRLPHEKLVKYLQISDCFLFPTLCQEGFGLSLIEALYSGNYCIASSIGGVPEVLQNGKIGKLVHNPHFEENWITAITEYLETPPKLPSFDEDMYSSKTWSLNMNDLINTAKQF